MRRKLGFTGHSEAGMDGKQESAVASWWVRATEIAAAAAERALPMLRRWGGLIGDWLAIVGWGKFFLLSLLLLMFGGIFSSIVFEGRSAVVVESAPPEVKVDVRITPEGIQVRSPTASVTPTTSNAPTTATTPTTPATSTTPTAPTTPSAPTDKPSGQVQIDESGVRILADKDGKQVSIVLDAKGVRVEEGAPAGGVLIPLPSGAVTDPDQTAAAVEAARDQIEGIVEEQVSRQVARKVRHVSAERSDWLMSFIVLLIITGIIVKVALGGKRKAETRAAAASASAAEEGLKRQLAEAQLKMMQAQVEPHFLFNTLASVDYLIETDPARASQMQKNLIAYLRASLPQMREGSTTLGKEVAQCRAYLEILKVRMDERLQYSIAVPQGLLTAQFPPMLLQSLVENSIKHGLEPKADGGAVTIAADVVNGVLRVTVADTGLGLASDAGSGVGLSNIRERLIQLYGARATFTVLTNSPSGMIAIIEVPYSWERLAS
ncbi:MAG: histidine kinase [Burkholderiaceae bacterium]